VNDIHTLSESDITAAEDMVKLLGPVRTATTIMCEEKQPTLSVIAPLRAKLLVHYRITEEDSALLGEMKATLSRELS
jgi:hypothetical protein